MTEAPSPVLGDIVPSGHPGVSERSVLFYRSRAGQPPLALLGTLSFSASGIPQGAQGAVTIHGWGGERCGPHRLLVRIGRRLAAQGMPTLRFDLAGRGLSEGNAHEADLDGMIDDALAAASLMTEALGCGDISYCGICSGGNVAIGAASLRSARRLALLSTLPFSARSADLARRKRLALLGQYARKVFRLSTWTRLLRGEIDVGGVKRTFDASGREGEEERRRKDSGRDIMADFRRRHAPCLFVYGANDPEAEPARAWYASRLTEHGIPFATEMVDEAQHNFQDSRWSKQVETAVVRHLAEE